MTHRRGCNAEGVAALGRAAKAVKPPSHAHVAATGRHIIADVIGVQPQRGQSRGRGNKKPARHRVQVDKDNIDVAIVIARVGNSVRTVVVKFTQIAICICLTQDLEVKLTIPTNASARGDIVVGFSKCTVALGKDAALHAHQTT